MAIINLFGNRETIDIAPKDTIYPEELYENVTDVLYDMREDDCNKGTFGTLGCICGSYGMAGAAMLCASAASVCGAGLVKCIVPDSIYPIMAGNVWEAVYRPLPASSDGTLRYEEIELIKHETESCTALVMGCGLKVTEDTEQIVCQILSSIEKPIILDADGINCISKHMNILKERTFPTILTPHPKEMSRLCGLPTEEIQSDREEIAKRFANEYGCILVLKGSGTVTTDGKRCVTNTSGGGALAKGGTGDVLAGMVGAFVCQGIEPFEAAAAAVYMHGYAADTLLNDVSPIAVTASDIIKLLKIL